MLSFSHLVILFLVALIVFGPEKLPELARTLGRWTMEFRRATLSLREAFERDLREIDREVQGRPALTANTVAPATPPVSSDSPDATHP